MTLVIVDGRIGAVHADKATCSGYRTLQAQVKKITQFPDGRVYGASGNADICDWVARSLRDMDQKDHFHDLTHPAKDYPGVKSDRDNHESFVCARYGDRILIQTMGIGWIQAPEILKVGANLGFFTGAAENEADALWRFGASVDDIFRVCSEMYPGGVSREYDTVMIPDVCSRDRMVRLLESTESGPWWYHSMMREREES